MVFLLFGCLIAPLIFLIHGCADDRDVAIVDFSKTQALAKPGSPPQEGPYLKVAVAAMISPKETFSYYRQLLDYIGDNIDQEVQLIQRKTYGEVNELLAKGKIDLAFICSGPYAAGKDKDGFELLVTPSIQGSPLYRAYLIVNRNAPFQKLEDLRGRVFAFTDPDSNTGKLVPTYWLAQMGERPMSFFSKTIYTYSHDNSIQAAINAAGTGSIVRIAQGTYTELFILDTSKSLTLQGGWNSAFTAQTPNTTIIKAPSVPQGSLTLQMVTIRP
jgi:phosphonate transport system substrate-binding protein